MNARATALILRQRRALRAARHASHRLLHGAATLIQHNPRRTISTLALLAVTVVMLTVSLTPGVYAYFNSVRAEEMIISFDTVDTGAVLKGQQTCTAFEPLSALVEDTVSQPRAWVETCVENRGKDATEGLEIVAILQVKDGDEERELARQTVDVSEQPVIQPGEKHCYAYPLAADYDPEKIYQAVAKVSVTNLRGWLPESANCPGAEPCRKGITLSAYFRIPADASPSPQPSESPTPTSTPTPFDTAQPTPTETPVLTPTETPVNPPPSATPPAEPTPTSTPPPTVTPALPPTDEPPPPTITPELPPTSEPLPPEPTAVPPTAPPPTVEPQPPGETPPP